MNKKLVDRLLPSAWQALADAKVGVAVNGEIPKTFRGQISSFGAAVSMGSLLAAAAFFNDQGSAKSERHLLMAEINLMLEREKLVSSTGKTLFDTVKLNLKDRAIKEKVLCCAVALKLAMNLYHLKSDDKKGTPEDHGEEGAS